MTRATDVALEKDLNEVGAIKQNLGTDTLSLSVRGGRASDRARAGFHTEAQ